MSFAVRPVVGIVTPLEASQAKAKQMRLDVLSDRVAKAAQLELRGDDHGALAAYLENVLAEPEDHSAWRGLARLCDKMGIVNVAQRAWQEILRVEPNDEEALRALRPKP